MKCDIGPYAESANPKSEKRWPGLKRNIVIAAASVCISVLYLALHLGPGELSYISISLKPFPASSAQPNSKSLEGFKKCSIDNFLDTGLPFLNSAAPLPHAEFEERRDRLAAALVASRIDAFVAEPGFTFKYYVNISQTDWEPWEPEERPFLLVIKPRQDNDTGSVTADTFFLAPAFEAPRVRLLGMPVAEPLDIVTWEEHWSPYRTLRDSAVFDEFRGTARQPKLMVDEEMRDFIQRGLGVNAFDVVGLDGNVERVRQIKSHREVEILRAVNTGTVEAVREMRKCLYPGLTENNVRSVLNATLEAGGLEPFFDIVLFDEDASNPHGGTDGSKQLSDETLVLIDVGAHLHGYSSDITRTFFPPYTARPADDGAHASASPSLRKKLKVWSVVRTAQTAAIAALRPRAPACSADRAARTRIAAAGFGAAFTHRVGHAIGIKAHESPFLHERSAAKLRAGMAFAVEPGVYLVGEFGVRTEDVVLVRAAGRAAEVLSGRRATSPWEP